MAGEHESFSVSLLADNQINPTFTGLPDYNIQAVTNFCAHPGTQQICRNFALRGSGGPGLPTLM